MKIIAIASLKGGVGKTALAIFLAHAFSGERQRVLAIDLDHNNNLTDYFLRGTPEDEIEKRNVYHALSGHLEPARCLYPLVSGISVMPCTISLSRIGVAHARDPASLLRFGPMIKKLPFDVAIIDTPPSLSYELTLALYAADTVLVPISLSRWSVHGFQMLSQELDNVSGTVGRHVKLLAVPALVSISQAEKLNAALNGHLSKHVITRSASVKNACDGARPLSPASKSFREFQGLAREVLK